MFDVRKETEVLRGKVEKLLRRFGATQITVFHESDSGIILQCIDQDGKKTFVKYEVRYYKIHRLLLGHMSDLIWPLVGPVGFEPTNIVGSIKVPRYD